MQTWRAQTLAFVVFGVLAYMYGRYERGLPAPAVQCKMAPMSAWPGDWNKEVRTNVTIFAAILTGMLLQESFMPGSA